jgi:hypothetical protein
VNKKWKLTVLSVVIVASMIFSGCDLLGAITGGGSELLEIEIVIDRETLEVGEEIQITVRAYFTNGDMYTIDGSEIAFTLSDDSLAEIRAGGVFIASGAGTVIIEASFDGAIDTFSITITDAAGGGGTTGTPGLTVTPTTGLSTPEAGGLTGFFVSLSSEPASQVQVPVSSNDTSEGTVSPSLLLFDATNWNIAQAVSITSVDDTDVDGDQLYSITVGPTEGPPEYNGTFSIDVLVTNTDNDTAVGQILISPTTGLEVFEQFQNSVNFDVSLNTNPSADVSITFTVGDSTEGLVYSDSDTTPSTSVTLTIPASLWAANNTVYVQGVDDGFADGDISFQVTGANSVSADPLFDSVSVPIVTLTNIDDDSASGNTVTVTPTTIQTGEDSTTESFSVVLDAAPTSDVSIQVSIDSGDQGEGLISPSSTLITLIFTTDNWDIPQDVTIIGVDDDVVDGDAVYTVNVLPASSADGSFNGANPNDVQVTNLDDDTAGYDVSAAGITLNEGASGSFTVFLDSEPESDVVFAVSSADDSEVLITGGSQVIPVIGLDLTLNASNWTGADITVWAQQDDIVDGQGSSVVTVAEPTSSDAVYDALAGDRTVLVTVDDTTPASDIVVAPTSGLSTDEATGSTDTFDVVLTTIPDADVTISVTSGNVDDVLVSSLLNPAPSGSLDLVFTSSTWNIAQTVTVTGQDDDIADGDQAVIIALGASSTDTVYNAIDPADPTVTNIDDDAVGITVTPLSGLTTSESLGSDTFTIVLESEPNGYVELSVASDNTDEGDVDISVPAFTGANWDLAQTITVTGIDDALYDGDVSYNVVVSVNIGNTLDTTGYTGVSAVNVEVTNANDDFLTEVYVDGASGNDGNPGSDTLPKQTLQAGIVAAVAAGVSEVRVAQGTYVVSSPVDLADGIVLKGGYSSSSWATRDPDVYTTTVSDSNTTGGTITTPLSAIQAVAGTTSTIDGFTINGALNGDYTAGVRAESSTLTITSSTISGGGGTTQSDAVSYRHSTDGVSNTLTVQGSTLNVGSGGSSAHGINVYHGYGASNPLLQVTISNNVITDSGTSTPSATAIELDNGNPTQTLLTSEVSYNHINITNSSSVANGIDITGKALVFNNIVIVGTAAGPLGQGIMISSNVASAGDYTEILSNTVIANGDSGSGALLISSANPIIEHNVLVAATGGSYRPAVKETNATGDPQSLKYNLIYNGLASIYQDHDGQATGDGDGDANATTAGITDLENMPSSGWGTPPAGNISVDPLVDADGYLTASSPTSVTEGGDGTIIGAYSFTDDIDGTTRATPFSIGAHEYSN